MFKALFNAFQGNQAPHALYGAVVAQSRHPSFFQDMGVPDTMNGRFEMMCIHIYLLLRRLKQEGAEQAQYNQDLFDIFIDDMEAGLREAGVGDTTVPKRIQKMSRIFYGRAKVWEDIPLDDQEVSDEEKQRLLLPTLQRNLYPDQEPAKELDSLATYVVDTYSKLLKIEIKALKKSDHVFLKLGDEKAA